MSDDIAAKAKARGWPDGLYERALAVKTPPGMIEDWISEGGPPPIAAQRNIEVMEALWDGRLRCRDLTFRDEHSFSNLWANAGEAVGDWEVTVERSPIGTAQFQLQGDVSITVLEEDGELVACTVWAQQNCMVAGERASVHYAQGLRVRNDKRRLGYGDIVRRFSSRALMNPTFGQVMYMRIGNEGVAGFLTAVGFQADRERPQMEIPVAYLLAKAAPEDAAVRPVALADLEACAEIINRTHAGLDLFMPLTAESLRLNLDGGFWGPPPPWRPNVYGWEDFWVVEADGVIVACGGLWDRGANMRERWANKAGETRTVEVTALLDFGFAEGEEAALARLIRALSARAAAKGRQSVMAPLAHMPAVVAALSDLSPREEVRTLEWSPQGPTAPRTLGKVFTDLRYW